MTKPGNGYLDHKNQGGTTGGSLCVHLERERVPVERFRLRDSDWKNACLPRSELSIREQRKLNSLHASISEASHVSPQVCFFLTASHNSGDGEREVTVHHVLDRHLNPMPSASPNAKPSTKSGTTSWDGSRLIFTADDSKRISTDILSVGTSEPASLGSPNSLI